MNTAVIGLGSNINPQQNVSQALDSLQGRFKLLKRSKLLNIAAKGNSKLADFVNCAVLIETKDTQQETKVMLKELEKNLGRTEAMHNGSARVIDLDIHVWNGKVVDPYFYQWDFIRVLVLELVPDLAYDPVKITGS